MCGYLCTGCGRCREERKVTKPFGTCLACGAENALQAIVCSECGAALVPPPGATLEINLKKETA